MDGDPAFEDNSRENRFDGIVESLDLIQAVSGGCRAGRVTRRVISSGTNYEQRVSKNTVSLSLSAHDARLRTVWLLRPRILFAWCSVRWLSIIRRPPGRFFPLRHAATLATWNLPRGSTPPPLTRRTAFLSFPLNSMSVDDFATELTGNYGDRSLPSPLPQRTNALSNKITSVLSTSFADGEIRDALRTLDERQIQNTSEARRRLRLDVEKDVIDANGSIIEDFGHVAEVSSRQCGYSDFSLSSTSNSSVSGPRSSA